jgi:outer membrane protein insertion porin family
LTAVLATSVGLVASAQDVEGPARFAQLQGGTIGSVRVEGNQRIEEGTIRSYMLVQPGDPFDPDSLDRSLKALYATGLFTDVSLRRDGSTLIVKLTENPIVNRIAFEGNHRLTDDNIRPEVQLKPRAVFTPAVAQADRQRILDLYAKRGRYAARVEPKIIQLDQNRVDVVYEISEGDSTQISRIAFVGNHAFSEGRLRDVINSREEVWWNFLTSSDTYDPERLNFDKEELRRFYLSKGYADFTVTNASAELAPDKSAFFVTFTLSEGERYRVGNVDLNVALKGVDKASLVDFLPFETGDWYDGSAVDRAIQALSADLQGRGYPFVEVKPRAQRDTAKHTIDVIFDVLDGPHVYVERIDITGNQRTMDKVIRREFQLAEGDPLNAELLRRTRQRLQDLQFFNSVDVTNQPGSAPDRTVVVANIEERATGELTVGGGYSTDIGALITLGVHEKNIIGTGIDAGINTVLAQQQTQINLSVTDPYFLDRNIVAGFDLFRIVQTNTDVYQYNETRLGLNLRLGYEFNDHLRQLWTYSVVQRRVYEVLSTASIYVQDEQGTSLLSQIGQTLTLDYRDSKVDPHAGWVTRLGTDFAGVGGDARFIRTKVDATYFIPLDTFSGNSDWGIAVSAGAGYLFNLGQTEKIIDNFFLGGDNLRGFASGGAGPHAVAGGDSLGGRLLWTQSTELHYPLPVPKDLGVSGRAFVDVGALSQVPGLVVGGQKIAIVDDDTPRIGVGVGISWKTPFGLINMDVAQPVVKRHYDQTQIFRLGFGTRF